MLYFQVPVIRMYGVNAAGNSVCAFVHGFEPYFYIERKPHWGPEVQEAIGTQLNVSSRSCGHITKGTCPNVLTWKSASKHPLQSICMRC
jgi:hypothetical protein